MCEGGQRLTFSKRAKTKELTIHVHLMARLTSCATMGANICLSCRYSINCSTFVEKVHVKETMPRESERRNMKKSVWKRNIYSIFLGHFNLGHAITKTIQKTLVIKLTSWFFFNLFDKGFCRYPHFQFSHRQRQRFCSHTVNNVWRPDASCLHFIFLLWGLWESVLLQQFLL